ncbi:MAG: carbohydrate ABC transporter permease [Bacillales bacterium]|jgi:raffinose/stachyose/melibiose transport system permease protein/N-acetylglucosamine transport system permease protein|nr:carbohydrate ABC transporter permease [Bacillales bacterium]
MNKRVLGSKSAVVIMWIVFVLFAIYAVTLIFPFVWMLMNSFKDNQDFFSNIWGIPLNFTFANYVKVFSYKYKGYNLFGMFGISILITLLATLLNTFLSTCAAYVVAKYKFFGRKILYSLALLTMILPSVGTLPAQYKLMESLHLNNSIIGILVLYSGCFGFTFFIMHGYFTTLSWTYAEAAFVDGASDFQVFWHVMLPLSKSIIIPMAVVYSIGVWNDYLTPSIYLKNIPTLSVGIRNLTQQMQSTGAYTEMFSAMIVTILPILIVFIFFQKTIMNNMTMGGIKG